jgi:hypothetical protein
MLSLSVTTSCLEPMKRQVWARSLVRFCATDSLVVNPRKKRTQTHCDATFICAAMHLSIKRVPNLKRCWNYHLLPGNGPQCRCAMVEAHTVRRQGKESNSLTDTLLRSKVLVVIVLSKTNGCYNGNKLHQVLSCEISSLKPLALEFGQSHTRRWERHSCKELPFLVHECDFKNGECELCPPKTNRRDVAEGLTQVRQSLGGSKESIGNLSVQRK